MSLRLHASLSHHGLICLAPHAAFGQSFEVTPVKAVPRDAKTRPEVSYTDIPLRNLLITAYGIKPYQLSGPNWLAWNAYDVVAKLPTGASASEIPLMLQETADRAISTHPPSRNRDLPVYALLVNKGGPKQKEALESKGSLGNISFTCA